MSFFVTRPLTPSIWIISWEIQWYSSICSNKVSFKDNAIAPDLLITFIIDLPQLGGSFITMGLPIFWVERSNQSSSSPFIRLCNYFKYSITINFSLQLDARYNCFVKYPYKEMNQCYLIPNLLLYKYIPMWVVDLVCSNIISIFLK